MSFIEEPTTGGSDTYIGAVIRGEASSGGASNSAEPKDNHRGVEAFGQPVHSNMGTFCAGAAGEMGKMEVPID